MSAPALRVPKDDEVQRLKDRIEELESLLGFDSIGALRLMGFTNKEAAILCMLLQRAVVSREVLFTALYSDINIDERPDPKLLDVHVLRCRQKFTELGLPVVIETKWGFGYAIGRMGRQALLAEMEQRMSL